MSNVTNTDPVVTESKLTEFYQDIKPFLGCPAYVTQEGDIGYYSTDEKIIGRWTNGKPLYQKIFKGTVTKDSTGVFTSVATLDIEDVVLYTGVINRYNGSNGILPITYQWQTAGDYVGSYIANGNIYIGTHYGGDVHITLQYTKKSDSAATTIETKPTHYSTDEQVVGTWVDGKPIYQKTISIGDLPAGNTEKPHGVANIDRVISHNVVATRNDGYQFYFPALHTNTAWNAYVHGVTATNIVFMIGSSYTSNYQLHNCVATIQYTKTTD